MKNVINIYDIQTYPKELLSIFETISINEVESYIENKTFEIIDNYYFLCKHVTRCASIENIKKQGILRPIVASNDKDYVISKECKNNRLNPFKEHLEKSELKKLLNDYDKNMTKHIKRYDDIPGYYGSTSVVWGVIEKDENIIGAFEYESIYNFFGGETLQAIDTRENIITEINKKTIPIIIHFKLNTQEIRCYIKHNSFFILNLIEFMYQNFKNLNPQLNTEFGISCDIPPSSILKIVKI